MFAWQPHVPRRLTHTRHDDVIDAIAANLNKHWPQQHALIVRPTGDTFQILSGHTRRRAADKAGIKDVWCWVHDISDDEAYMLLATSNNQGELSPLEIGIHIFHYEPKRLPAEKGAGNKGGLAAYARRIGKAKSTISEYRNAAEVIENSSASRTNFLYKAQHLSALHALPAECCKPVPGRPANTPKTTSELQLTASSPVVK